MGKSLMSCFFLRHSVHMVVLIMFNLHNKFEMSNFILSKDVTEAPRDPDHAHSGDS